MSDNELKSIKRLTRAIWACVITIVVLIPSAAFYIGGLDERVSHLEVEQKETKDRMIDETTFMWNDYFTRYLWAKEWNQPLPKPPYNVRGATPNL